MFHRSAVAAIATPLAACAAGCLQAPTPPGAPNPFDPLVFAPYHEAAVTFSGPCLCAGAPATLAGTGIGLLYQRSLADSWRGRVNLGLAPTTNGWTPGSSSPPPFTWIFAGGGALRDLRVGEAGLFYALGTILYKRVSSNEEHRSLTPELGYQYGPLMMELGVSFYETLRDGGQRMYVRWGWSLSLGLGVVWAF